MPLPPASEPTDSSRPVVNQPSARRPAPEPLALVEWLTESVGLSACGSPSESFAWVGDRTARFVVLPVGGEWYPTDRETGIEPMGVRVVDSDATPGTYRHPELPYDITVLDG